MNEKYEPIKFDSWQELAKFVIDGGEVYISCDGRIKSLIKFNGSKFSIGDGNIVDISVAINFDLYVIKQPTLEELIAIKPRLCWVLSSDKKTKIIVEITEIKDGYYCTRSGGFWDSVQMLTDDEIKQFLNVE